MSFLHRFLSDDDSICKLVDCIEELKISGSCSSNCFYECPSLCKVVIVTDLSPPSVIHHDDNFKKILIISVSSIITTLFLLALTVLFFKFYSRRRRRSITISRRWSMEEARNWDLDGPSPVIIDHPVWNIRTTGLNPTVISSIKVCKYSKKDGLVEGSDCSVCLSEFEEEERLRLLPKCKHAFHISCIDTWLRSHTNCPLCRAPIVVANAIQDDHSEGLEEIQEENEEEERDLGEVDVSRERVRRSVSCDSLSVLEVVGGRGKEKVKRGNIGTSIVGRSSFLKRSISYSGK